MKNGKNTILKEAVVLSIAALMILSSVVVMADTSELEFVAKTGMPAAAPVDTRDEFMVNLYDENTIGANALGVGGGTPPYTWQFAIRLTPAELGVYNDHDLVGAQFYHANTNVHSGTLKIYAENTPTLPGSLVASQAYTTDGTQGFFRIDLSTPLEVDPEADLWISVEISSGDEDYCGGMDAGPALDTQGDWANLGSSWDEVQVFGFDYNWCIDAILDGPPPVDPLEVDIEVPSEGIVGEEVLFESTVVGGVEPYTYAWDFGDEIGTSDEANPTYTYDEAGEYVVELTVTDSAKGSVTVNDTILITEPPAEFEIDSVAGGMGVTATVTNVGATMAENAVVTITVEGGLLGMIEVEAATEYEEIEADDTVTASASGIFGLGGVDIEVEAEADNADKVSQDYTAFVLLFFVLSVAEA